MCIFCKIGAGEIPVHKVAESESILAFLDTAPIRPGHVLIIPRAHHRYFEDLPEGLASEIFGLGQRLSRLMKREFGIERVGLMFTGVHVDHAHAHIVPLHEHHDITSQSYLVERPLTLRVPPTPPAEEMAAMARRLAAGL